MTQVTVTTVESKRGNQGIVSCGVENFPESDDEKKVLRAAAYCRVSTFEEDQEDSYELQKRYFEEKINKDPNMTLVKVYADQGLSGGNVKHRKQFLQMIQDCRDGKVDILYTKSISRFARNLSDALKYVRELKDLGIPVFFEKENINSMDPSSDFLFSVLAAAAQEELNDLSLSQKWANKKNNAAGNPSVKAPYGYRSHKQGNQHVWEIYEPEARRVRYAFRKAAEGTEYWRILDGLQKMEDEEGTGVSWYQEKLAYMLRHEAYTGDLLTNKSVTVDCLTKKVVKNKGEYEQYYLEEHHEPIVSKEEYEQVQENIKSGALHCRDFSGIPLRWRSKTWKKAHGLLNKGGTENVG